MIAIEWEHGDRSGVYDPCPTGIHVCGADEEANEFITFANFPSPTDDEARAAWEHAKSECQTIGEEPEDLVVDLMSDGSIINNFCITRQMLGRLRVALEVAETWPDSAACCAIKP